MEENKKETLEEAAENHINKFYTTYAFKKVLESLFIDAAKWQAERMYSEEEVLEFTQKMIQQYKFGNTNIEQMDLLKESLEQFKKK